MSKANKNHYVEVSFINNLTSYRRDFALAYRYKWQATLVNWFYANIAYVHGHTIRARSLDLGKAGKGRGAICKTN